MYQHPFLSFSWSFHFCKQDKWHKQPLQLKIDIWLLKKSPSLKFTHWYHSQYVDSDIFVGTFWLYKVHHVDLGSNGHCVIDNLILQVIHVLINTWLSESSVQVLFWLMISIICPRLLLTNHQTKINVLHCQCTFLLKCSKGLYFDASHKMLWMIFVIECYWNRIWTENMNLI